MSERYLGKIFTSESVTEGHPDKICDQVSDAILDACLEQDQNSRVACECFAGKGFILVGGEITTKAVVNYDRVVRDTVRDIGYNIPGLGFHADEISVNIVINEQSPDIALGTNDEVNGAGDQGIMFGYATNETPEYMPAPIVYAHNIVKELSKFRRTNDIASSVLRPDGKAQVTVQYDNDGNIVGIETILISVQHADDVNYDTLRDLLITNVIDKAIPKHLLSDDTKYLINPTGRFVIGGPTGDTGLTGRKIIVDSYGGSARHGGGAWSGKDATKVDRGASYMARYLAKNIVASGVAEKCEIQLAYAIGKSQPVSVYVDTFGTSKVAEEKIEKAIRENFDLTPGGIIKKLDLRKPQFKQLAAFGHVGRNDLDVAWEKLDSVKIFKTM